MFQCARLIGRGFFHHASSNGCINVTFDWLQPAHDTEDEISYTSQVYSEWAIVVGTFTTSHVVRSHQHYLDII